MKKLLSVILVSAMLLISIFSLTACQKEGTDATATATSKKTEPKKIGIVQIIEHASLDTIRLSIIAELEAQGFKDGENITIDYQNAQNDQTNLNTICQKFASNGYDLIIAIATPSAQAAVNATSTIPVIFSACTDPISSGLVTDLTKPGKNVTGTSDAVSASKIMNLAQQITPGIKTIGALYNGGETNSVSVINDLKTYAAANGMTVVEATVTSSSEVQQAVTSLVGKVDAIFSPIDNTVASAMTTVADVANTAKIPVYVGADSMVKDGGLATYGINYTTLGQDTADMAVQVLNGTNVGDIPVKITDTMKIYVNSVTASAIDVTIPASVLADATDLAE